ncbi:MAG: hypothetical protein JJ902_04055 [Roseibium sp.]|nr:hypothetical protein [Roseibium sp.]
MDEFLEFIPSRQGALRTDDELRAEFKERAKGLPDAKDYRARFEALMSARQANRDQKNADYQRAKPDAQKGRI